jgi:peptide/nickel transport system substrate-binding protein
MERRWERTFRRRAILKGGGLVVVSATLAGCDFFSTDPETEEEPEQTGGAKGLEAPMLAALVERGDLPPVEERLPANPLEVEPAERVGVYGGEWLTALSGTGDHPWLSRTVGYDGLTRWSPDGIDLIPNLAEEWEVSEDGLTVTFVLREGLKWSDGEPFTVEDIVFAQNDVLNNPELTPIQDANRATAEAVDDVTVAITFTRPFAIYPLNQATGLAVEAQLVNKPRHYLEQFHIDYNPEAAQLAEQEGLASWVELMDRRVGVTDGILHWQNPELPTMRPWRMIEPLADSGRVVFERNPFYWKVDPEGSQLPYLDRVVYEVIQDQEVILTRALNGDFDMHMRHFNTFQNQPVLAENRESGGYDFFETATGEMNTAIVALNLTTENPVLNEVFNNQDFRIGLSHAINRQEIIDVVYQQQGEPWQAAPRDDTPFFNETLAKQYTEFDVDLANEHLDAAGYRRDGQGRRLGPDGQPIVFTVDIAADFRADHPDAMEMVRNYWLEVGVDARIRTEQRELVQDRKNANQHDAIIWPGDNGGIGALLDPRWYFPFHQDESMFAIPWARWYETGGQEGAEPPPRIREQMDLYHELEATADAEGQYELMRQILQISQEEFWVMGLNLTPPGFGIVASSFHNVPEPVPNDTAHNAPGPSNPEQYFIEEEE